MFLAKFQSLIICVLIAFFAGCNIDKSPLKTDTGIDPAIMGDWYYETTGTIAGDIIVKAIHGVRISQDGVTLPLAVEVSTGKLAELPELSPGTFLFAQNGRFKLRTNQIGFYSGPATTYNSTYRIEAQELMIETMTGNGPIIILHKKYLKSAIGNIVADPVDTHLEMMTGNDHYANAPIYPIPSAYAGYFEDDSTLIIHAISQRRYVIVFSLETIIGTGVYKLGSETSGRAALYPTTGDVIGVISTDQHPYAGSITIESFDIINRRCSGTFYFKIANQTFTNGVFSVPIYDTN
jgi:hypothetical protein